MEWVVRDGVPGPAYRAWCCRYRVVLTEVRVIFGLMYSLVAMQVI